MDMIKNEILCWRICAYPNKPYCEGCKYMGDPDDTRASEVGCSFKGANALMDEVLERPLSSALEESYKNGFNDGQAEGMPLELSTDDAIPFSDWLSIHDTTISKAEREKVLKGILMAMNDPQLSICDTGYLEHAYWVDYIKSLRSEQP